MEVGHKKCQEGVAKFCPVFWRKISSNIFCKYSRLYSKNRRIIEHYTIKTRIFYLSLSDPYTWKITPGKKKISSRKMLNQLHNRARVPTHTQMYERHQFCCSLLHQHHNNRTFVWTDWTYYQKTGDKWLRNNQHTQTFPFWFRTCRVISHHLILDIFIFRHF